MSLFEALLLDPYPFEVWIATRTDGIYGSGTRNDPWDGGTTARFDAIMSKLAVMGLTNVTVHLGPGIFTTTGYVDDPNVTPGWQIQSGMRIVGAGMGVTTLRLAFLTASPGPQFVVGHRLIKQNPVAFNAVDFCEVADLTIDCNQGASSLAAGAVRLMGNHVRIRRVNAIGWGALTGQVSVAVQLITAHTDTTAGRVELEDMVIEDCVANFPFSSMAGSTTVFHAGAKDLASSAEGYGLAPVIRNCYVDGTAFDTEGYPDSLIWDIRALAMANCRAGVVEGNQVHNVKIGGPYQEQATTRDIIVRGNTYKNVTRGPWWKLGSMGSATNNASVTIVSAPSNIVEVTSSNHNLSKGERVRISNAPQSAMNGVFVVASITSNTFQYVMETTLSQVSGTVTFQKVFGAGSILVENNVLELASGGTLPAIQLDDGSVGSTLGANQGPDFTCTEVVLRENQVGYLNSQVDATGSYGADIAGVKNAIIRNQVLETVPSDGIQLKDYRCRRVSYFNNRSPSGDLIQGYNATAMSKYSELETQPEDLLVVGLM